MRYIHILFKQVNIFGGFHKYVPIEWRIFTVLVSRRMIFVFTGKLSEQIRAR
jgi:hypothetical protein